MKSTEEQERIRLKANELMRIEHGRENAQAAAHVHWRVAQNKEDKEFWAAVLSFLTEA